MSVLLIVPLKKTYQVDITNPLKKLINSSYNGNNANAIDHSDAINELSKLRITALDRPCVKYEQLDIIYNYYDQLIALESKIPMHQLQDVPFKWKNAFERKLFKGRITLALPSFAYEKKCILFNIAALQSAIAAAQGTYRDDGFKLATQLLQQSAGIFAHLKRITSVGNRQESTCDLDSDTLQVLSNLMLAQAQEIFVLKAIKHHMKESTIAQLAISCKYLYERVLRDLQKSTLRSIWDKDWISTVAGKQSGFHAIAQLYQSVVCRNGSVIGEEISRLQYSIKLFKAAKLHSGKSNLYEEFEIRAKQNSDESNRNNHLIYNALVPDVKSLVDIEQAQLAKITPFNTPLSLNSKDLFVHLVPVVLHQAITTSDARKSEIINEEVMKLRESTEILNDTLVRLNLPAAIEETVGSTLPRSILIKSKDIKEKGGVDNLCTLIAELPQLLKRNQEILNESNRMLNEEIEADKRLRTELQGKWTRHSSDKLNKTIRSNINKYQEIIHNAVAADEAIRKTFDKYAHKMELLSKPTSELESDCPIESDGNISNYHSARKLHKLMDKVDKVKAEREIIESEFKSSTVDLKEQFLAALAKDGAINETTISDASIRKIFNPLCKRANENILQQKILIEQIQSAFHTFERECKGRSESRDEFLSELAGAYDAFITLQKHLKEGMKFYNDLTQLLVTFQHKVFEFCTAREKEMMNLLTSIDMRILNNKETKPSLCAANRTNGIQQPLDSSMNFSQDQYRETDETANNYMPPMPKSFNPYATYTIKRFAKH